MKLSIGTFVSFDSVKFAEKFFVDGISSGCRGFNEFAYAISFRKLFNFFCADPARSAVPAVPFLAAGLKSANDEAHQSSVSVYLS